MLSLDGSRFVQILIASGYSVLNVIVSPDIIQDVGGCTLKDKCKRDTICYALEDCSASSLYNLTQCAVHEITSVSSISGSLWSEHNDIAAGSDFRIFGQEGSSTLYKILENPSVLVQDFPCPSSPTSIIPWRQVSRSDPKWSMSTQDSLVDIWVMEESQRTCNILAVVFMALFGLSVVVLVLLLVYFQKKEHQNHALLAILSNYHSSGACTDTSTELASLGFISASTEQSSIHQK